MRTSTPFFLVLSLALGALTVACSSSSSTTEEPLVDGGSSHTSSTSSGGKGSKSSSSGVRKSSTSSGASSAATTSMAGSTTAENGECRALATCCVVLAGISKVPESTVEKCHDAVKADDAEACAAALAAARKDGVCGGTSSSGGSSSSAGSSSACNSLVDVASPVTATCSVGTVPVATGGTIADGTYTLTAGVAYASACPDAGGAGSSQITLSVHAGVVEVTTLTSGGPVTSTSDITTQGHELTVTPTCGEGIGGSTSATTVAYTATSTTLTIFETLTHGTAVLVFTKTH